ncbi:MAG: folate-binding protein, partial [Actinomycetota bacterium]|nr:folate-binding protein [Actinomycetota bacterium]
MRPQLSRPGAVPADPPDEGVAAHYGDPYAEQRRLEAGEALVDLSHRPVLRVAGPDRLSWLHSLLTQHLTALTPGAWTQALVLSPQGHVEHHLHLLDDGDAVLAHVEPGTADALVDFLRRMQFMLRVEVTDVSDEWAVVADPALRLVPRAELAAYDGAVAGVAAWEALRVVARTPRLGLDTDHRTLPHEVGWLTTAVHLDKGCYRGQETVARVHNLGRPPRRLVLLHLDG